MKCTLLYRRSFLESPSFRLNSHEVESAIAQGVDIIDNANFIRFQNGPDGEVAGIWIEKDSAELMIPAHCVLIAIGTTHSNGIEDECADDFLTYHTQIIRLGDLNPNYRGSVVQALASAKELAPVVDDLLKQKEAVPKKKSLGTIKSEWTPRILDVSPLTSDLVQIIIHAPRALSTLKPGQFFRFGVYDAPNNWTSTIPITGIFIDCDNGTLTCVLSKKNPLIPVINTLTPNHPVFLMGPTGCAALIPVNKTVLLMGGGIQSIFLIPIARALKEAGCTITFLIFSNTLIDHVYELEMRELCDHFILELDTGQSIAESLTTGFDDSSHLLSRIQYDQCVVSTPTRMLNQISGWFLNNRNRFHDTFTARYHTNAPMQCMMKGVCGRCIQKHKNPDTGEESYVFSCAINEYSLFERIQE